MALIQIISGGQTGVDRGALDAALAFAFPCGGWCPGDRSAEDGVIPAHYPLEPLPGAGYRKRTLKNVQDSDGTAIFHAENLTGGTLLTRKFCVREAKPFIVLDARRCTAAESASELLRFIEARQIAVLNVAGPRRSVWAAGHGYVSATVELLVRQTRADVAGSQGPPRI